MKILSLFALIFCCSVTLATAAVFSLSWTPSPDDAGAGFYTISALAKNAPAINGSVVVTNVPGGTTNVWIEATNLPANPCFIFGIYCDGITSSPLSTPLYFDTNDFKLPVRIPFSPGPVHIIPKK